MENDSKLVAEEWLNELIEELYPANRKRLVKAIKEDSIDELSRSEELLYIFIREYKTNYGILPASIMK